MDATASSPAGTIRFAYDASTGIRVATYDGTIDDACLLGAYRALITSPAFVPDAHDLADLRGVARFAITPGGLRSLGQMMSGSGGQPPPPNSAGLAIVADTPIRYGIGRMYELMTQGYLPKKTRVFRIYDEALDWLHELPKPAG
jgi:hypothetical protein